MYKRQTGSAQKTIHNYFFLKGLDAVRDGGIVAFITSHGVLNLSLIHICTMQRMRTDHRIEYVVVRGSCRYRLSEILRLLEDNTVTVSYTHLGTFAGLFRLRYVLLE